MAGRLLSLLAQRPRLIVSLPSNCPDLAQAAADGGADALKVHLHVRHEASGTEFGDLAQERGKLEDILKVGIPVGVVPGAGTRLPSPDEMRELVAMGVDFFDLYVHDMPAWLVGFEGMTRGVAVSDSWDAETLDELGALGFELLEAAVIAHEGYGEPLSAADLVAYRRVRRATSLPIIVPTQRAIRPEEAPLLVESGINAIMIGVIVTGREPRRLRSATEQFASAVSAGAA